MHIHTQSLHISVYLEGVCIIRIPIFLLESSYCAQVQVVSTHTKLKARFVSAKLEKFYFTNVCEIKCKRKHLEHRVSQSLELSRGQTYGRTARIRRLDLYKYR